MAEPLVDVGDHHKLRHPPRAPDAFYRAAMPLSHQNVTYVAATIRLPRAGIGRTCRKLNPAAGHARGRLPRKGESFAGSLQAVGVGHADRLAVCERDRAAARGRDAETPPGTSGGERRRARLVVLDGTVIPIDRVAPTAPSTPESTVATA